MNDSGFSTSVTASQVYSTGLSGKAGLVQETLTVLRPVAQGQSLDAIRQEVLEGDLLAKASYENRRSVWEKLYQRYLSDWPVATQLARMVRLSPDRNSAHLLVYYEFCRSERVLYDAVVGLIYQRFSKGFTSVEIRDLQEWLDAIAQSHPEVERWSPQTRKKVLSNILTVLRDFGLMAGTARKTFQRVYLPLPVFGYILYRLRDSLKEIGPLGIVNSRDSVDPRFTGVGRRLPRAR